MSRAHIRPPAHAIYQVSGSDVDHGKAERVVAILFEEDAEGAVLEKRHVAVPTFINYDESLECAPAVSTTEVACCRTERPR